MHLDGVRVVPDLDRLLLLSRPLIQLSGADSLEKICRPGSWLQKA